MLFRPQQSEGLRVDWLCVLGEAGFAPRHLELSDVSDVFDRCVSALTSEKTRERVPVLVQSGRRLAGHKSTSHGEKQLISTEAADDGKARHEGLDRARNGMAGETVVPVPAGDGRAENDASAPSSKRLKSCWILRGVATVESSGDE